MVTVSLSKVWHPNIMTVLITNTVLMCVCVNHKKQSCVILA